MRFTVDRRCQLSQLHFPYRLLGPWLILCLLLATVGVNPSKGEKANSRYGGTYRLALRDNPTTLDPARMTDIYAHAISNQIFDGLVQFDGLLNPVPAVAGFWKASPDGLTWTFYLRKGIKFHHGREVTADDFVYSFTRLLDPAIQSPAGSHFKYIRGANAFREGRASAVNGLQALNRHTLQIILEQPYAPFLSILAMANAKVVPREKVEAMGDQFGLQPVGSGPFVFQRWEQNRQIVLKPFQDYHEGCPFLDQLVFKMGSKDLDSLNEFLNGGLEEVIVPVTKRREVQHDPRYRPYRHFRKPVLHLLYIGFNTAKEPFTNPKVRQAFNYAINKQAIVEDIRQGNSVIAKGILPLGMPGYNPQLKSYDYDPGRAKQLLAEAGYPGGKGLPEIDLWYSSRSEITRQELEVYQKNLADVGVILKIHEAANWRALKARLVRGEAMMFRVGWHSDIPDPDNFFFPLLASQSKTNRTFYQNPQLDQMLEAARRETDYRRRIRLYRDMERMMVQQAPWISQHHRVFEYLYQPYVRGMQITSLGAHYVPMKKIWLQKRKRSPC